MSEERGTYQVNSTDALVATAEIVAHSGGINTIRNLRESFLNAVDVLERAAGIRPTTSEIRRMWRDAKCASVDSGVPKQ